MINRFALIGILATSVLIAKGLSWPAFSTAVSPVAIEEECPCPPTSPSVGSTGCTCNVAWSNFISTPGDCGPGCAADVNCIYKATATFSGGGACIGSTDVDVKGGCATIGNRAAKACPGGGMVWAMVSGEPCQEP